MEYHFQKSKIIWNWKRKNEHAPCHESGDTASYVGFIWVWFFSTYTVSVEPFQCNVLFLCVFVVSFFPLFPFPRSSILSRTGRKESQEASNLAVPMTMCLFPVPFPLTPSLRPQVSSINPTVTRSLLYSVLRDAPADRGGTAQQSRDAQLSEYPSLDYQGLYATLVTLLDLVPLLQNGQHGECHPKYQYPEY